MDKLCDKLDKDVAGREEGADLKLTMNIAVVNALWGILVGENLDLDNRRLKDVVTALDKCCPERWVPVKKLDAPILFHSKGAAEFKGVQPCGCAGAGSVQAEPEVQACQADL